MQEVDDKPCRRGRLFRDPVPAIRDDQIFDLIGDTPHHRAHPRAECSFASQGPDRHLKLALRKERPVVGCILAERQELGKARSHCAGLRIERRIMLAKPEEGCKGSQRLSQKDATAPSVSVNLAARDS
jgi:hypothetical protein